VGDATVTDGVLTGTLEYDSARDGVTFCDTTLALSGSTYTGDCDGCDWSFAVEATITADASSSDCYRDSALSLEGESYWTNLQIAFWEEYRYTWGGYYGYYGSTEYDLFRVGYGIKTEPYTYYGPYGYYYRPGWYAPGPYWTTHSDRDTVPYGRFFTRTGDVMHWEFGESLSYTDYNFYRNFCGYYGGGYSYASGDYTRSAPSSGSLPCTPGSSYYYYSRAASTVDVWSFYAAAGDVVAVSVDTVDAATAFDPTLWINGPDTCTSVTARDNFTCTEEPWGGGWTSCPSAIFYASDSGTHQAVVSASSCVSTAADYTIDVLRRD